MQLFDSHAHLTDERLASELDQVFERASASGVQEVVSIASRPADGADALALAERSTRPRVWATVGLHPHEADAWSDGMADEIRRLADAARVVAIGETGLDFHYENAPRRAQMHAFRAQIELADALALPLVVHSRDADDATAAMVKECMGKVTGVLHCFTGGPELLRAGLEADWYVSFSGIVTFRNYRDQERVRAVPADRLLLETDSPYLAPEPVRGRRNEPAFVEHVARRVAEIRDEPPQELAERSYENACRFYRIEG